MPSTSHIPTSKQRAAEPRRTLQHFRDKQGADTLGSYLFQPLPITQNGTAAGADSSD